MLKGKFVAFNVLTEKEERFRINDLQKLEKEEQIKPEIISWKGIIKSRPQ